METADMMQPLNMTGAKYDSLSGKQKNRWTKLRIQRNHEHIFKTVARMRSDKVRLRCWCGVLGPWQSNLGVVLDKLVKSAEKAADSFVRGKSVKRATLAAQTVPELRQEAKTLGVRGYSKMPKADLVEALVNV